MSRMIRVLVVVGLASSVATSTVRADDPAALSGPAVKERNTPGVEGSFGGERERFAREQRIPPKVFREAIELLSGENAAPQTRMTEQQAATVKALMSDYEKQVREYQTSHRDEVRELRAAANQGAGPRGDRELGKGPVRPQEPMDAMQPGNQKGPDAERVAAARDRLRQIAEGAPKVEELQTKIWKELTPEQRAIAETRIAEYRAEESKRRQEQYVNRQLNRSSAGRDEAARNAAPRPPQPPMPPGPGGPGPGPGAGDRNENTQRLLRLWDRLSPEQQRELLNRLENRIREQGAGQAGDRPSPPPPRRQRDRQP